MSDFLTAWAFTSNEEGGYGDDPADAGGETYRGVARKKHPEWPGWPIIDGVKVSTGFLTLNRHDQNQLLAAIPVLQAAVVSFYQLRFWNPLYAQIGDQAVATKIFDLGVNEGCEEIILIAQRACTDLGQAIAVDGAFGSGTLRAVNACDPVALLAAIKARANEFYDTIEEDHPAWKKRFDAGWRKRVNA